MQLHRETESNPQSDNIRTDLFYSFLERGIKDEDELHLFIRAYLHYFVPRHRVCPHHVSPFDFIAEQYFERETSVLGFANRAGGKTLCTQILSVTECLTKPGVEIVSAGAVRTQADRGYVYVQEMLGGERLVAEQVIASLQSKTQFFNGSMLEIVTASYGGFNSPHSQKVRIDEVELLHWSVLQQSMSMSMEKNGWAAGDCYTSTRKITSGTMQKLLDMATEKNLRVMSWCVPPETLIVMADGATRAIEKLTVGDIILSHTATPRRIDATFVRTTMDGLISVTLRGLPDPLRLTPEHEVLTVAGRKVAGQLTTADVLMDPRMALAPGGDLEEGWLVGLYLAEGYRAKGNCIGFAAHEKEVDKICARIQQWWDIHPLPPKIQGPRATRPRGRCVQGLAWEIRCHHPTLRVLMDTWTVGRKSQEKRLMQLPAEKEFAQGVLEGWLDGDGSAVAHGRVGQTSSESLAWQMLRLAHALGFPATLWRGINRPGPGGRVRGETTGNPFWRVTVPLVKPRVRHCNIEKFEQAQALRATGKTKNSIARTLGVSQPTVTGWFGDARQSYYQQPEITASHVCRPITRVERVPYVGPVHDLTVAEDHTFIANGVAVSNCIWEILEPCKRQCHGDPVYGDCPAYSYRDKDGKEREMCGGKAHDLPPGGYFKIVDFVKKVRNMDRETWETEWLNLRPSSGALVYGEYFKDEPPFVVPSAEIEELLKRAKEERWQRVIAIDFGANFYAGYFMRDARTKTFYQYGEYWYSSESDLPLSKHAQNIRERDPLGWDNKTIVFADPSGRQAIRDLEEHKIFAVPASNDVYSGLNHVKKLLQIRPDGLPGLRFFHSCPRIRKEMGELYIHPLDRAGDPQKDKVLKRDDHGCFVAGTMVETSAGPRSIETIQKGDLVLTRQGYRRVKDAAMTSLAATVNAVEFSDGRQLIGTGNHPIGLANGEWRRLDDLRYGDIVTTWQNPNLSSSMASDFVATPTRLIGQTVCTTVLMQAIGAMAWVVCMRKFGSRSMGRFQTVMKFTIATVSHLIMSQVISFALRLKSIGSSTKITALQPNNSWPTWSGFDRWLVSGTALRRDENGIVNIALGCGNSGHLWSTPAITVASSMKHCHDMEASVSALMLARRCGDERTESTTLTASVAPVVGRFAQIATVDVRHAPIYVRAVEKLAGRHPVYNLTVDDAHEYFANGILASNCDALRYAMISYETVGTTKYRMRKLRGVWHLLMTIGLGALSLVV